MVAHRSNARSCLRFPVVLGETEPIARQRAEYLNSLIDPELAKATGSAMLGADLGKVRSAEDLVSAKGSQGHGGLEENMRRIMKRDGVNLEEANCRSHRTLVGTPIMVADAMQEIFDANGCDGFVLQGNVSPMMFEEFGRMVAPELQNRGILRSAYSGSTMRENLLS